MTFTFKLARRLAQSHLVAITALCLTLGSCAPGHPIEGGLEPPSDEVLAIHLAPDSVSLNPTEFVDFFAIAELSGGGQTNVLVDWEATGGTITADGRYTAGSVSGHYRIRGIHKNGKEDSAVVVVNPPAPGPVLTGIIVTPGTVALLPSASQSFSASGVLSDGSSMGVSVTWSTTGGTVTAGGDYTAPATVGNYLVVATQQGGSFSDTAQVSVAAAPPTLTAVLLTPPTASLEFGRTQPFAALGQLSDGSTTSLAVTWIATGGTINSSGLYTAGSTAGTFRVIARAANGLADTSSVTVTAPTITAVTITPPTVNLQSGQTQQFSASATLSNGTSQSNPSLTWVATGGAINGTGLFTAGATAGSFRVIGTSANGHADTSTVTISLPTVTAITMSPATVTLSASQTQQFSVSATLSTGGTQANPSVTWSATGGSINVSGLYSAGTTAGNFRVIAAAANGPADTSTVTITPATITTITVTPPTASLTTGQTQQFNASAAMSDGSTQTSPSVTWSATGGTVSSAGLYAAGSTAGSFRVIAAAANGKADTSAVTITVPTIASISLTPPTASLQVGATQQFTVSATMSDGSTQSSPTVTYTATGGSITTAGLYTAGSTAGAFRVIAASANGKADTSAVTITAATVASITLTPATVSLPGGQTQQFSVSASMSDGSTQSSPAVSYSATGGSITSAGLYTAASTAGAFRVIAASANGKADTSAVTITAATIASITLTPPSVSLPGGQTQQFSASATMSDGSTQSSPAVTYTSTGGSTTAAGLYTAGSTTGSFQVIAASANGKADTSAITITAATIASITLTPPTVSLTGGQTQQFSVSAAMSDGSTQSNPAVTYTATGGGISVGGLFTAGSTAGSFRVIAASANGKADTSAVTITAPTIASVVLVPATVSLETGTTQQFSVSATLSDGSAQSNPSVTYTVTGGTINGSGLYTAGSTAGSFRVIARAANGPADTSSVTLTAPTITAVTITPPTVSLQSGQTQQFSASATLSNGATQSSPPLTWTATGGTINGTGLFTAGATAGSFQVIGSSANGHADTSAVTISTPTVTAITVSPATVTIGTSQTQQFSASATLSSGGTQANPSVTWSATGGSISASGLYTAGSTAGSFQVIAVLQGGTLADTSAVTLAVAGTGSYPNRPANYTRVIGELDMSQPIPAGTGERYLAGLGNTWSVIYDDWGSGTHWQQTTDATPPGSSSPGTVWKLNMPAGSYGGGVPGVGGGTDFGAIGRPLPNLGEVYISEWIKWDPTFEFHPISTKHMRLDQAGHTQAFLLQASHNSEFLRSSDEEIGQAYDPQISTMPTRGVWHQLEVVLKAGNPGTVKIWLDGVLRTSYTNLPLTGPFSTLQIDGYFGGGGMVKQVDSYYEIDHLYIAAP